ncbi:MAG: NYN domain-containing protein [Candidatus Acidiferrales bacterium]
MCAAHPPVVPARSPLRVCTFVDGYNLFKSAKQCFGYDYPNYDIRRLAQAVIGMMPGRALASAHFYVGIPKNLDDPKNNLWWTKKLAAMGRTGVLVETRYLRRRELRVHLGGIVKFDQTIPRLVEKGIDLKIGLDMVRLARSSSYDVAILFSQDGDLVEAVTEVQAIAAEQHRKIQVECAYPVAPGVDSRPINRCVQRQITKAVYDTCIDPTDYRI